MVVHMFPVVVCETEILLSGSLTHVSFWKTGLAP